MGNKCCESVWTGELEQNKYKRSEKTLMMKIILIQRVARGFIVRKKQLIYNMKVVKGLNQYSHKLYNDQLQKYGLFQYSMDTSDSQIRSFIWSQDYCGEVLLSDDNSNRKPDKMIKFKNKMVKDGRGVMVKDGVIFEGYWVNDLQQGRGRMITDSMIYDGEWKQGLQNGIGIEHWNDGSCFIGEFKDGYKCSGKMEWTNQNGQIDATYNGQFINDKMQGQGQYESSTKSYKGQWTTNQMEGYGQLVDKKKNKMYIGQFSRNKKQGIGLQIEPEVVSIGYFKNNRQQRKGICVRGTEFMWLEWKDGSIINQFTDKQVYQDKEFMMFYDIHQLFINNQLNEKALDSLEDKYQVQMDSEVEFMEQDPNNFSQNPNNISHKIENKLDQFQSFPIKTMTNLRKHKSDTLKASNQDRLQFNNQSSTFQFSLIQSPGHNS